MSYSSIVKRAPVKRVLRLIVTAIVGAIFASPSITAQELRGTLLQPDGVTPASGAVVMMTHPTIRDSIVARTVSGDRGTFALKAPSAMTVRLRILRIGFQAMELGPYTLATGAAQHVPVTLSDNRVTIAAFDVREKNRCEKKPHGAMLVAQLFDQARAALINSASTVNGISTDVVLTQFERNEDRNGRLIGDISRTAVSGTASRAFGSISAKALARNGYVVEQAEGTIMYSPDADVLTSASFIEQHCLFLVDGTDSKASMIGIGFRPVSAKRDFVDIRGTLWVDRNSAALKYVEYLYEGLPVEFARLKLGGQVNFAMTAAGYWFVSGWEMRKPRMTGTGNMNPDRARVANSGRPAIAGVQIIGGEVQSLQLSDQLLYSNSRATSVGARSEDAVETRLTATTDVVNPSKFKEVTLNSTSTVDITSSAPKAALPPPLAVPANRSLLLVTNEGAQPLPYATISNGSSVQATDEFGRLILNSNSDTVQLVVRRMGHEAFSGKIGRASTEAPFRVMLRPVSQQLNTVNVRATRDKSPLALTGFYERMADAKRSAVVGEFLTPEILDSRPSIRMSEMLRVSRYLHFINFKGHQVMLGAGECEMTVMLDGSRVVGDQGKGTPVYIDELLAANEVMGVEIYRSTTSVPAALLPMSSDRPTCGVVAIWTGARR